MTSQDKYATGGSTQGPLNSTAYTTSNASENVTADSQSETSKEPGHEDHGKAQTVNFPSENDTHSPPMAPEDLEPSTDEGEGNKLKDLIVADLRDSLTQIMKEIYQRGGESGKDGLGARISRNARDQLKYQAALLAYVTHLETTVASLTGVLEDTHLPTLGLPHSHADFEDKPGTSGPQKELNTWKVEVKRWKEIHNDHDKIELIDDASAGAAAKESQKESSKHDGHVLTSYKECSQDKTHVTTRLEVNSSILIDILRKVIVEYPADALTTLLKTKVIFHEPFMMIFHHDQKLREEHSRIEGEAKEHLGLLLDFLREQWPKASETSELIDQKAIKEISYNELWLLYSPGTIVYTKKDGEWCAYKVHQLGGFHRLGQDLFTPLRIECFFSRFDSTGTSLKTSSTVVSVSYYSGNRAIGNLEFVPAGHMPEEASIGEALIVRGQRYWEYKDKGHFQNYTGTAWPTSTSKDGHRVMIDHSTSSKFRKVRTRDERYIRRRSILIARPLAGCFCSQCGRARMRSMDRRRPYDGDSDDEDSGDEDCLFEKSRKFEKFGFSDAERLLCCSSEVSAFSLRDRSWRFVKVSQLGPVKFRNDAFKKLVIKGKHKTVIKAMVRSYLDNEATPRDLIQGKGRGLIVLLHGSPGTGKTLTAECVAEKENRPLYMVTCGDLGTRPDELEKRLRATFEYAVNWNAILLLDEADVFLQERDVHDLKRNALVSVFLRGLEYFDGILFLTTNRPGSLDEAFQSRIQIAIGLPELDAKSQFEVWTIFVKDLNLSTVEKINILEFVKEDIKKNGNLNGRQIRNGVKTALALAAQKGERISKDHVRDVLEIGRDFTKYLHDVNRMDLEQRAVALGHRASISS